MPLLHFEAPDNAGADARMTFKMKGSPPDISNMVIHAMNVNIEVSTLFITAAFQWMKDQGMTPNSVKEMYIGCV